MRRNIIRPLRRAVVTLVAVVLTGCNGAPESGQSRDPPDSNGGGSDTGSCRSVQQAATCVRNTYCILNEGCITYHFCPGDGNNNACPPEVNFKPVSHAGPNILATVNDTVSLDGSNSYDANDDTLTYRWLAISRPPTSSATLDSDDTPAPSVTLDRVGTYLFGLNVSDGRATSDNSYAMVVAESPGDIDLFEPSYQVALDQANDSATPLWMTAGFIDSDGNPDILRVDCYRSVNNVISSLPDDSGNYSQVESSTGNGGCLPFALLLDDYNNDSSNDLIFIHGVTREVILMQGDGVGGFSSNIATGLYHSGTGPASGQPVAAGDFNGDDWLDLFVDFNAYYGDGAGNFTLNSSFEVFPARNNVAYAIADIDDDGLDDIVAELSRGSLSIIKGKRAGALTVSSSFDIYEVVNSWSTFVSNLVLGDVVGDQKIDILVETYHSYLVGSDSTLDTKLDIFAGGGSGDFAYATTVSMPMISTRLLIGDYDRDSHPDIAALHTAYDDLLLDGYLSLHIANGSGKFSTLKLIQLAESDEYYSITSIVQSDINADDKPDLIFVEGTDKDNIRIARGK